MYKVDKDVPPPRPGSWSTKPWPDMKVGESVFFEGITLRQAQSLGGCVHSWAKRHNPAGMKFTMRKVDGGYRIWRIA
jgi:hypothetical protein